MGGKPLMALAIVGMPINVLPHDVIAAVLKEAASPVCADAGIPAPAGGHSIDSVEPIYGPGRNRRGRSAARRSATRGAQAGDVLIPRQAARRRACYRQR